MTFSSVNLADGIYHHLAVTVYEIDAVLYIDGQRNAQRQLPKRLEDSDDSSFRLYVGAAVARKEHFEGE